MAAAPIGRSVRQLRIPAGDQDAIAIDEPIADKLREHAAEEIGELQTMILRTDGFTFHTRKLSVEHPDRPGYLSADVKDPIFDEESNPCTMAAQKKALIRVTAKPGYRGSALEKLYSEIEDAA